MAIDAYIKFDQPGPGAKKIPGESQDSSLKGSDGWNGVQNVTFGSENVANVATNTGGSGAGKLAFKEFAIKKQVDNSSPVFFLACCNGGHYGLVSLYCRKTGPDQGAPIIFLKYSFAEVKVLSIDVGLSESDAAPMEDIKFSYAAMKIEYAPQTPTGGLGAWNIEQWSQTKNKNILAA